MNEERKWFLITVIFAVGAIVVFAGLLSAFAGYLQYLEEIGGQQACVDEYGQSAEYIGETSVFGGSVICETPEGQQFVDKQMAGPSPDNFIEYVNAALAGEA